MNTFYKFILACFWSPISLILFAKLLYVALIVRNRVQRMEKNRLYDLYISTGTSLNKLINLDNSLPTQMLLKRNLRSNGKGVY